MDFSTIDENIELKSLTRSDNPLLVGLVGCAWQQEDRSEKRWERDGL